MNKVTDARGNEIKEGDYILIEQEDFYTARPGPRGRTRVLQIVSIINTHIVSYHVVCRYSQGWGTGCWSLYNDSIKSLIPKHLIEKGDKKLIKAFVKLEGFDVEEDGIEL